MIYYISDNHWNHANIILHCNRPFKNVEEMNAEMTKRWNETVKQEDTVYYLGDFSLGKGSDIEPLVASLRGELYLVYGNHDKKALSKHKKAKWLSIQDDLYIQDGNQIVWLNHFPYGKNVPDDRGFKRPSASRNWDIALCGHVHNKWLINEYNCINVGGDNFDFIPQTLEQLITKTGWSRKIKI